jgi:hypothetical protein
LSRGAEDGFRRGAACCAWSELFLSAADCVAEVIACGISRQRDRTSREASDSSFRSL